MAALKVLTRNQVTGTYVMSLTSSFMILADKVRPTCRKMMLAKQFVGRFSTRRMHWIHRHHRSPTPRMRRQGLETQLRDPIFALFLKIPSRNHTLPPPNSL